MNLLGISKLYYYENKTSHVYGRSLMLVLFSLIAADRAGRLHCHSGYYENRISSVWGRYLRLILFSLIAIVKRLIGDLQSGYYIRALHISELVSHKSGLCSPTIYEIF